MYLRKKSLPLWLSFLPENTGNLGVVPRVYSQAKLCLFRRITLILIYQPTAECVCVYAYVCRRRAEKQSPM